MTSDEAGSRGGGRSAEVDPDAEARTARADLVDLLEGPLVDGVFRSETPVVVVDGTAAVVEWNEPFAAFVGDTPLADRPIRTLFTGDDPPVDETVETGAVTSGTATLRTADGPYPCEVTGLPLDEDGTVVGAALVVERVAGRRDGTAGAGVGVDADDASFIQTVVESVRTPMYVLDEDLRFAFVNDLAVELAGVSREELFGAHVSFLVEEGYIDVSAFVEGTEEVLALQRGEKDEACFETVTSTVDGERVLENNLSTVTVDGAFAGVVNVVRDVTDQRRRERRMEGLQDATRRMMTAATRDDVADVAVETARQVLDLDVSGVWLVAPDGDRLEPVAYSEAAETLFDGIPTYEPGNSISWLVFESGENAVFDDVAADPAAFNPETPVGSEAVLSLGDHGVMNLATTATGAFDGIDRSLAQIHAANTTAALDRAEREELLRERDASLAMQRDELETINRVNAVLQETIGSLVDAGTRSTIEQTVCDTLVESSLYEFALVRGQPHRDGDDGVVRATAGLDDDYISLLTSELTDRHGGPVFGAVADGEPRVVSLVDEDPSLPRSALATTGVSGVDRVLVVPITHGDTVRGSLVVGTVRDRGFNDNEAAAFGVLGRTVGFAVNAIEHRHLLFANHVVELELRVAAGGPFCLLSTAADATCTLQWVHPAGTDRFVHYVSVDCSVAEVQPIFDNHPAVEYSRVVDDGGDTCELEVVASSSVVTPLIEAGATFVGGRVSEGLADVTAEIAPDVDARELIGTLQECYDRVELRRKRERERSVETVGGFDESAVDDLTDRQREVLRTAFEAGYYDWPRGSTAEELAESLGVAAPTVHQHLRKAENKVLSVLFDDAS